jgi:hypothetical protein
MESVRSLKPQPRKGGRGLGVLLCSLVAWGSLGFVAGSGAHPRPRTGPGGNVAVGHLVGGIYDKRCPSGGRVTVRNRHGAIVARETLNKAGQKFRFRLIPGRYAVKASCGGSQPKRVRVVAGRTTRANLYCGIR